MIWFFTRGPAQIDIEVRRLSESGGYALVVSHPDGTERIEAFTEPKRLIARVLEAQQQFIDDGWLPTSPEGRGAVIRVSAIGKRGRYLRKAKVVAAQLHRTVTRRLAAAFGL